MYDKRRYVRMGTVFPVEFTIVGSDTPDRLLQGFTCNVSEGGMCIEFKSFGKETEQKLNGTDASLNLVINPAFSRDPILAFARIIWLKKEGSKYLIGVAYETIDPGARRRLISFARRMRLMPRLVAMAGILLLAVLAGMVFHGRTLWRENLKLTEQLREGALKRSAAAGELISLSDNRRTLEARFLAEREENKRLEKAIKDMNYEVIALNAQSSSLTGKLTAQKTQYENELAASRQREAAIRSDLLKIRSDQEKLRESYQEMEKSGREGAEAVFRKMAQWLSSHQNMKTGLVASYEGDPQLEDTAFTYDQALAAQAFLLSDDATSAGKILSFYDSIARHEAGAYFNSYDTIGGSPQETTVHTGPNLWIGIAALQYAARTGDARFVPMAGRIGDWALRMQDAEGGLRGGPEFEWYSTEHNLDAYAFFGMLGRTTGDTKYALGQEKALSWLKKFAYSNKGQLVNRGKGDATIATDTFAWSIAAIGPSKLIEMGFDPEAIMEFAQKNCEVSVEFRHPDGQAVSVSGFDFAKAKHVGRGGVISTEWTAQMAVSYQRLARHFRSGGDVEKARRYSEKAGFYLNELQKMVISSPSRTGQGRGCLPYASADSVETGHGWRTPQGASTGSVAGTAYGLFAWKGFNPFELSIDKGDADAAL